ncbi:hypothetical protein CERSUDRAFT_75743 [Gelatoporia subvermispora B]|uniref:F-box domain-containing protein n=1 Tax=Ceriporiopsis subvermispora (strain B) TaxID=914234 RepID=M2R8T5_CERS8|nr:hypothetical protein CERSUDRAFT_75743 [Gelatoporia subvermispora B]
MKVPPAPPPTPDPDFPKPSLYNPRGVLIHTSIPLRPKPAQVLAKAAALLFLAPEFSAWFAQNPRGLPPEIFYRIMNEIDDLQALLTCGFVCRHMAFVVKEIIYDRITPFRKRLDRLGLQHLRRHVHSNPLTVHLLQDLTVSVETLVRFVFEFSGNLHNLRTLNIEGDDEALALFPMRMPFYSALSCFRKVTKMSLRGVGFSTFRDFARFICSFPGLLQLELVQVSWRTGAQRPLAEEPFAKSLNLHQISIMDNHVLKYSCLLNTSQVLQNISVLALDGPPDPVYTNFKPSARVHFLDDLGESWMYGEDIRRALGNLAPSILSVPPPYYKRYIDMFPSPRPARIAQSCVLDYGWQADAWLPNCLQLLYTLFTQSQGVHTVHWHLDPSGTVEETFLRCRTNIDATFTTVC